MVINLNALPKEVRDIIELKEQTDQTFSRFCVEENELLFLNNELRPIKNVKKGDIVIGKEGSSRVVKEVFKTKKKCLLIKTDCMGEVTISEDHLMYTVDKRLVKAKDLVEGDVLMPWRVALKMGGDYDAGFFAGVYLADGHSTDIRRDSTKSGCSTRSLMITNSDEGLLNWCSQYIQQTFNPTSVVIKRVKGKKHYRLIAYGKDCVRAVIERYGAGVGRSAAKMQVQKKHIKFDELNNSLFLRGFLNGFSSCDLCCGGRLAANAQYSVKSTHIFDCLLFALRSFGFYPTVERFTRKDTKNSHWIVRIPSAQLKLFLEFLDLRTKHKEANRISVLERATKKRKDKQHRKTKLVSDLEGVRLPVVKAIRKVGLKNCVDITVSEDHLFALGNGLVTHNCDEEYSEILWNILAERGDPGVEHSFIGSIYGQQGCYSAGTKITTKCGLKNIEDVVAGDLVWSGNAWRMCIPIKKSPMQTMIVKLRNGSEFVMTPDHVMFTQRGEVAAEDMVVGDRLVAGNVPWSSVWNEESEKAAVIAMLLADGHVDEMHHRDKYKYVPKTNKVSIAKKETIRLRARVRFYKSDKSLRSKFQNWIKKYYSATASSEYSDYGTKSTKVVCIQNRDVFDAVVAAGVPIGKKSSSVKIPDWILQSDAAMNGFLAAYFACDGSFYNGGIEISSCSEELVRQIQVWLLSRGCISSYKVGKRFGNHNDIHRLFVRQRDSLAQWLDNVPNISNIKKATLRLVDRVAWTKYSDSQIAEWKVMRENGLSYQAIADKVGVNFSVLWKAMNKPNRGVKKGKKNSSKESYLKIVSIDVGRVVDVFDLHVRDVHEYLANGCKSKNSGKSFSAIAMCCFLDPNFSIDNIYFDYNDLIYNRHKLKPNTAILVDEQSQSFGLDSHRVMIILAGLKEQLRKKSIHFIFCSPVLYEEHKSSMFLFETMFIDYENQECFAAMKTRDGLTLGHVRIPHPNKVLEDGSTLASKELIEAYQKKKDAHLEKLLGRQDVDIFEERARQVMKHPLFVKANKLYRIKMGYIPQGMLIQIINKIYPEFNAGVVPVEIAGRIKLDMELSGKWEVSGQRTKKTVTRKQRRGS